MRALGCLIIIFVITAGLWYWVISSVGSHLARVTVVQYEDTLDRLPLNSLEITKRRKSAYITGTSWLGDKVIASRKRVKLGRVLPDGQVEILSGLANEDTVIKRTSRDLQNRMRIEIVDDQNAKL